MDTDEIALEEREALHEEILKQNKASLFKGDVEHAYSKDKVARTDTCPRCHAATQLYCAHFIYATDVGTRVMLAPAGYFCTQCPTVIVDESIITAGIKPEFQYEGVIGVDFDGKKEPCTFSTWNGKKAVYLIDEEDGWIGLSTVKGEYGHGGSGRPRNRQKLKKSRRQMAKRSRRQNRRR